MKPSLAMKSSVCALVLAALSACVTVEARPPAAAPLQQGEVARNADDSLNQLDSESAD